MGDDQVFCITPKALKTCRDQKTGEEHDARIVFKIKDLQASAMISEVEVVIVCGDMMAFWENG